MPSFQALPAELVQYIVDLLIESDIGSANSLLQTCKALASSKDYSDSRCLKFWLKSFFPSRKRLPRSPEHEANLLQQSYWPKKGHDSVHQINRRQMESLFRWYEIPTYVQTATKRIPLSRAARLIGDTIYDISHDGLSICALECTTLAQELPQFDSKNKGDSQYRAKVLSLQGKILSYDVDLDENIIVLLLNRAGTLFVSIRSIDILDDVIMEDTIDCLDNSSSLCEAVVNESSVLISIGNNLQVFKWKDESNLRLIWSRSQSPAEIADQFSGLYIKGFLLSNEVVACTVIYTVRNIGSTRVSRGTIELYRLDQYNPKVADITSSESSMDALQPNYLQNPYRYIAFSLGGKRSLSDHRRTGQDRPVVIQTFAETRIGGISSLADILYPRSALALYSESHPILGREWLRGNFPLLSDPSPLQSSLHGNRMLSCSKRGKHQLIYWDLQLEQPIDTPSDQVATFENIKHTFNKTSINEGHKIHIDQVCVDGPRALFICYRSESQHNGTIHATQPIASFWTDLRPAT